MGRALGIEYICTYPVPSCRVCVHGPYRVCEGVGE